jgi:hypothetical protein
MDRFPILVSGPPGSGKTTKFIESIARGTLGTVWVLEPVQKIVGEKSENLQLVKDGIIINNNIRYINYAAAFVDNFYVRTFKEKDIFVIDEAHLLFFTEFRKFQIKTVKEILELFKRVVFITATPEILEIYLKGNGIEYFKQEFEQRLERKKIVINFIPTKFFSYINPERVGSYDIIISDNIKNLKKLEEETKDKFSLIYSYFNENNNLMFKRKEIRDVQWIGTCAMGQGIDKFNTLNPNQAKVLFDGNTFKRVPDTATKFYRDNINENYYKVMFKCLTESIIQTDRFRIDLDVLHIDLLLDLDLEHLEKLKNSIQEYFQNVYRKSNIEFTSGDGLYTGKDKKFTIKEFQKCIDEYDILHQNNKKSYRVRLLELVEDWCDPIRGDKRVRKIGHYKSTLQYFNSIFTYFFDNIDLIIQSQKDKGETIDFDSLFLNCSKEQIFTVQKGIVNFVDYLIDSDFKDKVYNYLKNDKEKELGEEAIDLDTEFYTHISYVGETLLQILFAQYGVSYSMMDAEQRSNNPFQLLPKYLRYLLIKRDIDIVGCHIVAMIKKITGDNYKITKEDIEKIYSYNSFNKEEILKYIKSFKKLKDIPLEEIEKRMSEREICKKSILYAINRLKYKKDPEFNYINTVLRNSIPALKDVDIRNYGEVGYWNGIKYEEKWLGEFNLYKGVIFRIADGLGQSFGNEFVLEDVKERIMQEHLIPISDEDIEKYKKLDLDRKLDYFIQEAYLNRPEITKEVIYSSLQETLQSLEKFRRYIRKGATKGKTKGKSKGQNIKMKKFRVVKSFIVKGTNIGYKSGIYEWGMIPKEIPVNYQKRYIRREK